MIVFILLCGAIFGLITVVLTTTASLQANQIRRDQVSALNSFLKRNVESLPASGVLVSYRRGTGDGLTNTGVITGQGSNLMAIDAKIQVNGYYTLRVTRFGQSPQAENYSFAGATGTAGVQANPLIAFENIVQNNSESLQWTPLIHDVSQVGWRFQGANTTRWNEQWFEGNQKPNVAEFTIQLVGDLQPAVMDFWIPNLTPPPLFIAMPTTP